MGFYRATYELLHEADLHRLQRAVDRDNDPDAFEELLTVAIRTGKAWDLEQVARALRTREGPLDKAVRRARVYGVWAEAKSRKSGPLFAATPSLTVEASLRVVVHYPGPVGDVLWSCEIRDLDQSYPTDRVILPRNASVFVHGVSHGDATPDPASPSLPPRMPAEDAMEAVRSYVNYVKDRINQ